MKEALQATVGEGKGGRAGGLSLLFHRLGYLYLGKELPPQRWIVDSDQGSLDEIEWELQEAEDLVSRGEEVPEERVNRLRLQCACMAHNIRSEKYPNPSFVRLRALTLMGRIVMLV